MKAIVSQGSKVDLAGKLREPDFFMGIVSFSGKCSNLPGMLKDAASIHTFVDFPAKVDK